ncbi:MAG: SEC-C metal-binding domain-containing protein [Roseburia sp.]|nr:SEC-C metal-binding domain-containing protein [Roseburia sp.]
MLLREHLKEHNKDELLFLARGLELQKCSILRKQALIDRIAEAFCTEEMLRIRLSCLTKEQMDIFRRACAAPTDVSTDEAADGIQLYRYWTGYFEEQADRFHVFEDIAEIFGRIDDEAFREEQSKKGWMVKCVQFFINYYGIAPAEVLNELYGQKVKCTVDEMIRTLGEMPEDIVLTRVFTMDCLEIQDCPEGDPLYSPVGLALYLPLLAGNEWRDLLRRQKGKPFYIPSARQIEEIYQTGYEASSRTYKKMEAFLMRAAGISRREASGWSLRVWTVSCEGEDPTEVISEMSSADIVFESEEQVRTLMDLMIAAYNNTRMQDNRGYKPIELMAKRRTDRMPTIVPGSSFAASLLRDAEPQLKEMGIPVDLEGDTTESGKKVYPNDPCPCGSGKKYKKCCGRNRGK